MTENTAATTELIDAAEAALPDLADVAIWIRNRPWPDPVATVWDACAKVRAGQDLQRHAGKWDAVSTMAQLLEWEAQVRDELNEKGKAAQIRRGARCPALVAQAARVGLGLENPAAALGELRMPLHGLLAAVERLDPSRDTAPAWRVSENADYGVRNRLVLQAVAEAQRIGYQAGVAADPEPHDRAYPVVAFIELPGAGQVSWHLPAHPMPWDGHSREVKELRISDWHDAMYDYDALHT